MRSITPNRIFAALAVAGSIAATGGMAVAQQGPGPQGGQHACGAGQNGCAPRPMQNSTRQGQPPAPHRMEVTHKIEARRPGPANKAPAHAYAPHVGDSARHAPRLQQAKSSRLPPPPHGQHYRVFDNRVVRVDDSTLKIVAIVGLATAVLNASSH